VVRHTYKSLGFKRLITRICKIYTKHVVLFYVNVMEHAVIVN